MTSTLLEKSFGCQKEPYDEVILAKSDHCVSDRKCSFHNQSNDMPKQHPKKCNRNRSEDMSIKVSLLIVLYDPHL